MGVLTTEWGKVGWIHSTLLSKPWGSVGNKKALRLVGKETVTEWSVKGLGALRLWPVSPPQDNASKLLLALMESRHDSENAERILISLRPQELVRLGWGSGGAVAQVGVLGGRSGPSPPCAPGRGHSAGSALPGGRHQEGLPAGRGA